jgi:hypothetical protein
MYWAGWVVTVLPALALLFSAAMKFAQPPEFAEGLEHIGWTKDRVLGLAFVEIACTLIYLFPRTSVLGAILITGYLGGATATHVRVDPPGQWFAPIILGVLVWLGIYLRCGRVRALIPLRS